MTYIDETRWKRDPWDDTDITDALVVERPRRYRRPVKWFVWLLLYVGMAGIVVVGVAGLWYSQQVNPKGDPGAPITFTVEADDTLETVSERLQSQGLVDSAKVFRWYVEHHDGLELIPGYFRLRPDDHMGNIMRILRTPPSETFTKVTFPEGYTFERMGRRLEEKVPRLSAIDFNVAATDGNIRPDWLPEGVNSLEGLLFPDTYQVSNGESAGQLVERMVKLMERVGRQENIEQRSVEVGLDPYKVLIVASLIEREAKVPEDRAKIARVIYNRLYLGMPLGIDAALLYGQPAGSSPTALREVDTPYNTYMHVGLPPTPIANPGRASIQAALNPVTNPSLGDPLCVGLPDGTPCLYLYYVIADADGRHVFAATLEQHEANVQAARDKGLL
ncbi:MAG: endolytic transglycosylase MltG [Ilumatobacteraceae bacterium]